jgi:hypothetical protein
VVSGVVVAGAGLSWVAGSVSLCVLWVGRWTWAVTGGAGMARMAESTLAGSSRSLKKRVAAVGWGTVRLVPV